jgi:FdhE protein
MPALSRDLLDEGGDFARTLDWFLRNAAGDNAPPAAEQALARLGAADWPDRLALAEAVFDGAYPPDQIGECLYVAAALQLHLTRLAAQLDAERLRPVGDGVCPACGGLAAASMIVSRAKAERSRYCCCGLCATQWNYVRIKCTICGSTAGISYRLIEEQSSDVAVEICTSCHSYIKHLRQHRTPAIEPFADDIASYGLDLLVREEGFVRPPATPFMIIAPAANKEHDLRRAEDSGSSRAPGAEA